MITSAFMLLLSGVFLSLRLGAAGGSFPRPLDAEAERKAVDAWVTHGDLEARNLLVEHNLRLVAHIIKKYYAQTVDPEDLISIGTIGLIKGVSTYRPDKNVRLATYASRCIENAILSPMAFQLQKTLLPAVHGNCSKSFRRISRSCAAATAAKRGLREAPSSR